MRRTTTLTLAVLAAVAAGCGGGDEHARGPSAPSAAGAARPAAPATAAVLSRVPDSAAARRRLGYVDAARLAAVPGLAEAGVRRAVLGAGARSTGAVRVGDRLVVAQGAPAVNAIAAETPSAVQSCLGDAAAETIVGPAVLGTRSAIGAGVRPGPDGGHVLAVCAAPHLRRDLRRIARRLRAGLPGAVVRGAEIGERDIVMAEADVAHVPRARLLALLSGGRELRRLATG